MYLLYFYNTAASYNFSSSFSLHHFLCISAHWYIVHYVNSL